MPEQGFGRKAGQGGGGAGPEATSGTPFVSTPPLWPPEELRPSEQALRRQEERFRSLVLATSQVLWTTDADGRAVEDSPSWRSFTGQTLEEWLGYGWLDAIHPDDRERVRLRFEHARRTRDLYEAEYRLHFRDGTYRLTLARGVPLLDEAGRVREWVGANADITEKRQAETVLAGQREVLEQVALGAPLPEVLDTMVRMAERAFPGMLASVLLLDAEQRLHVTAAPHLPAPYNRALEGLQIGPMVGSCGSAASGRQLVVVEDIATHPNWEGYRDLALPHGLRACWSAPILTREGKVLGTFALYYHQTRAPTAQELELVRSQAHLAGIAIGHHRFQAHLAESLERERQAREAAEEATRVREEFLSVASHELKTPLTPLTLTLQQVEQDAARVPDGTLRQRVLSKLEVARRQVRKLSGLVDSLLNVARISRAGVQTEPEQMDLAASVRDITARFEAEASKVGCALVVHAPAHLVGHVDPLRFEQVVSNLLSNALKYGAGQPVALHLAREGEEAVLTVRDEGIGIAPEQLPRIFDRFTRAVSERNYGGLGLGLYITRTIVEAHGGSISVQSRPGAGTTFTVRLPLAPPVVPSQG